MHTVRYNPSLKQWMLVGAALPEKLEIARAHAIEEMGHFKVITHPHNPFVLAPDESPVPHHGELLHPEQPPVGEYEVLLYNGGRRLFEWTVTEWEHWFQLVQRRVTMLHHNPYVHHVLIGLDTSLLETAPGHQRVGEIVGSQHQFGCGAMITPALVKKIGEREGLFRVYEGEHGFAQVPSGPSHKNELWYLPTSADADVTLVHGPARHEVAAFLAHTLPRAYQGVHVRITMHTSISEEADQVWWMQLYEGGSKAVLPISPRPESMVQRMHQVMR